MSEHATKLRASEESAGLNLLETYASFTEQVHETKRLLGLLLRRIRWQWGWLREGLKLAAKYCFRCFTFSPKLGTMS